MALPLALLLLASAPMPATDETPEARFLASVARDIEALKKEHPQLRDFHAAQDLIPGASIQYSFRTHRPTVRGGWRAAFPEPDDEGVSFLIQLWDGWGMNQAATQPLHPPRFFRSNRVVFLIREGKGTKPVVGRIEEVLRQNGMVDLSVLADLRKGTAPAPLRSLKLPAAADVRRRVAVGKTTFAHWRRIEAALDREGFDRIGLTSDFEAQAALVVKEGLLFVFSFESGEGPAKLTSIHEVRPP